MRMHELFWENKTQVQSLMFVLKFHKHVIYDKKKGQRMNISMYGY